MLFLRSMLNQTEKLVGFARPPPTTPPSSTQPPSPSPLAYKFCHACATVVAMNKNLSESTSGLKEFVMCVLLLLPLVWYCSCHVYGKILVMNKN